MVRSKYGDLCSKMSLFEEVKLIRDLEMVLVHPTIIFEEFKAQFKHLTGFIIFNFNFIDDCVNALLRI